jgi:hypothetical protein
VEVAGDGLEVAALDVGQVRSMTCHTRLSLVVAEVLGLHEQALAQVARGHAHGVEALDQPEHLLGVLGVEARHFSTREVFESNAVNARR